MQRALKGFFRTLLFPPKKMQGCRPPLDAERLAQWEIRMGQFRARERLRKARVHADMDARAVIQRKGKLPLPG